MRGIKIGNLLLLFTTNKHPYKRNGNIHRKKKEINNPIKPSNNNIEQKKSIKEYLLG